MGPGMGGMTLPNDTATSPAERFAGFFLCPSLKSGEGCLPPCATPPSDEAGLFRGDECGESSVPAAAFVPDSLSSVTFRGDAAPLDVDPLFACGVAILRVFSVALFFLLFALSTPQLRIKYGHPSPVLCPTHCEYPRRRLSWRVGVGYVPQCRAVKALRPKTKL